MQTVSATIKKSKGFLNQHVIFTTGKARSKRRSIHAPNLTDELSTAEERRLNQFGSDGVLASNLIREAGGNNFRRENMRSEFTNSVQIEKL